MSTQASQVDMLSPTLSEDAKSTSSSLDVKNTDGQIEYHMREILKLLSITNEEVLQETPRRFRKLMQKRTTSTRQEMDREILRSFEVENPGIVIVKDLEVTSICEHHLMPFFGTAAVAYMPKNRVLGLSKIARIVDYCSKKENLQERLTQDIVKTIDGAIENDGICVLVKCKHFCMVMNDEVKSKGETVTVIKTGKFKDDPKAYEEFMATLKL